MNSQGQGSFPLSRALSVILTFLLAVLPGWSVAAVASEGSGVIVTGALTVASNPVGAHVYVDGRFAGQTPLSLDMSSGDHRVRVVKEGYLENSRVVTVQASERKNIDVRLTANETAAAAQVTGPAPGGGGGSKKKWLWIGIAGGAAAGTAAYLMTKNSAPTVSSVSAAPTTAIQAATNVSFSAQGSDSDGDSLTYTWDFGDGGSGSGSTVSHVYNASGVFTVSVSVSDGKKSASGSTSVTVRSLSGTWRGTLDNFFPTTVVLTQNAAVLTGTYSDTIVGSGTLSAGSVSTAAPRVRFTVTVPGFTPFAFTGDVSADGNSISGTVNGSGFVNDPWVMSR